MGNYAGLFNCGKWWEQHNQMHIWSVAHARVDNNYILQEWIGICAHDIDQQIDAWVLMSLEFLNVQNKLQIVSILTCIFRKHLAYNHVV